MKKIFIAWMMLGVSPVFAAENCQYSFDPTQLSVEWKAYKTTEKLPVGGRFVKVSMRSPRTHASKIQALLTGAQASVELSSVETGNPARDQTLKTAFFEKFLKMKSGVARGTVVSANVPGKVTLQLEMNGKKKIVILESEITPTSEWVAKGNLDILEWGLQGALESLNQACQGLHQGKDGVSKTWSEVELSLKVPFQKKC